MKGLGTNTFYKGIEEESARGGLWVFTQEPVSLLLRKDSLWEATWFGRLEPLHSKIGSRGGEMDVLIEYLLCQFENPSSHSQHL